MTPCLTQTRIGAEYPSTYPAHPSIPLVYRHCISGTPSPNQNLIRVFPKLNVTQHKQQTRIIKASDHLAYAGGGTSCSPSPASEPTLPKTPFFLSSSYRLATSAAIFIIHARSAMLEEFEGSVMKDKKFGIVGGSADVELEGAESRGWEVEDCAS